MRKNLLKREVVAALGEIDSKIGRESPWLASQIMEWINGLSPTTDPVDAFCNAWMFPMFLPPFWLAETLEVATDHKFHSDIVYSTVNGYLYIRMLDNLMDGHSRQELRLLPASALFYCEFHRIYQLYFAPSHPFWESFDSLWLASSEAVIYESGLQSMNFDEFSKIATKKLSAAQIPLVAACYHYDRSDLLQSWLRFMDLMARCWQFADDLYDWHKDLRRGACTYFLSTAMYRKEKDENVENWVAREGFAWGTELLQEWGEELLVASARFRNPNLDRYLQCRATVLQLLNHKIMSGLKVLTHIASLLSEHCSIGI